MPTGMSGLFRNTYGARVRQGEIKPDAQRGHDMKRLERAIGIFRKTRKMYAVRRYLKTREKVYIARRDAGINLKEEERLRSWISEYACYLEADAHWLKVDYERRMG